MDASTQQPLSSGMLQQTDGLDEVLATLNLKNNDHQSITEALAGSLSLTDVCASAQPLDKAIRDSTVAETMPTYQASRGTASPAQPVPGVVHFNSGEHASYAEVQAAVARRLQPATAGPSSAALLFLAPAGAGLQCGQAKAQLAAITPMALLSALGGSEDSPPAQPPNLATRASLHLLSAEVSATAHPLAQSCSPMVAPAASSSALSAESVFVAGNLADSEQWEQDIDIQLQRFVRYDTCLACGTLVELPRSVDADLCLFCAPPGGAGL